MKLSMLQSISKNRPSTRLVSGSSLFDGHDIGFHNTASSEEALFCVYIVYTVADAEGFCSGSKGYCSYSGYAVPQPYSQLRFAILVYNRFKITDAPYRHAV